MIGKFAFCARPFPLLLAGMICLLASRLPAAESRHPNFIIILCDDLGYGDIEPFGAQGILTPNLVRMASEGLKLTSFYASGNVCTPSRAGLLTGRYAVRMGLAQDVLMSTNTNGLPTSEITLAESLQPLGYKSACIGKWHLGIFPDHHPYKHGFDYFYGIPYSNDMYPSVLFKGEALIEKPVKQETLTQRYTVEAIQFMEENKDHPFFLYLAHTMPHIPLAVSEKFSGRSKAGLYGDVVEELDWSVGEVLEAVKRLGLDENTLVIFTSDNGPWFEGSAGPFRARKGETWEGGARVPFIARWPGRISPGETSDVPASNLDFFPTLTTLAGGKVQTDDKAHRLDGIDMFPILAAGKNSSKLPEKLLERPIYMFDNTRIGAVRSGKWKLAARGYYRVSNFNLENNFYKPGYLIDLSNDPGERYNVSRDHPQEMKRMLDLLAKGKAELLGATPEAATPNTGAPAK